MVSGATIVASLGVQLAATRLPKPGQASALAVRQSQPALAHLPL